jgi:hypothetical protein
MRANNVRSPVIRVVVNENNLPVIRAEMLVQFGDKRGDVIRLTKDWNDYGDIVTRHISVPEFPKRMWTCFMAL